MQRDLDLQFRQNNERVRQRQRLSRSKTQEERGFANAYLRFREEDENGENQPYGGVEDELKQ